MRVRRVRGIHQVTDSSHLPLVEIEVMPYVVAPTEAASAEGQPAPGVWRRRLAAAGVVGAGVLLATVLNFVADQSWEAGKAASQPKIDQLEESNLVLADRLNGAQQTAEYFADRQRADAARASSLNYLAAGQGLPWLSGRVDVYFNGVQVDSIGNPIVLSPSFGAYSDQSGAAGWQAVVSQSRNFARGVEAYTRDAQNTTFQFFDGRGEPLADQDVWNSPNVRISQIELQETLDGWSQLATPSGQLVGSTDYAG